MYTLSLCVLATLVYVCASRAVPSTGCPTTTDRSERNNAGSSQSLLEIYAVGAKAKLSIYGNTSIVITVPWEKRGEHSLQFNWYQKDLGKRFAVAFGTATNPPQFLAIDEKGDVTVQGEEDNSIYFTRERTCGSTAPICRHFTFHVTHRVTSPSTSGIPIDKKFYLAAASNGTVYAQTKKTKKNVFIECGHEDNKKENCWWTRS